MAFAAQSLCPSARTSSFTWGSSHGISLFAKYSFFLPQASWAIKKSRGDILGSVSLQPVCKALEADAGNRSLVDTVEPKKAGITVLVVGGGGREHALCFGLKQSATCDTVFCAPGNPGISASGDARCIPDLDISSSPAMIDFCQKQGVDLVVVGPEAPLVEGLVDDLQEADIMAFGPSAKAAALEGSKEFMKKLCVKYNIPTAKYRTFTNAIKAKEYIKDTGVPIVVKADGLAAGKGVIVAMTIEEALTAVDMILVDKAFGSAGELVIIEEFLEGEEVSFFALVDGETALPLASAQDHKRVGEGDTGPNTVKGMAAEGCKFVGILYAGLIIDKSRNPKLLEFNVRFGDPECQVLIPRLKSDLATLLLSACKGELNGQSLQWSEESALVVVLASKGYPGQYNKGSRIMNLDAAENAAPKVKIFHSGTGLDSGGNFVACGGRVLGVTALGSDIVEAKDRAYRAVDKIIWSDGFCRRDIGWRAVQP